MSVTEGIIIYVITNILIWRIIYLWGKGNGVYMGRSQMIDSYRNEK